MPSEEKKPSKDRSDRGDRGDRDRRSKSSSSTREKVEGAKEKTQDAIQKAKDAAWKASDAVAPVLDTVVDAFGGWDALDKTIKDHNPTLAEYAEKSFLGKLSLTNSPSKFVLFLIALGMIQSVLPVFAWPLDFLSRLLGFLFLHNVAMESLSSGWRSSRSAPKIKALLATFLITSLAQLVPAFFFDMTYHFGALWSFFLPSVLFVTPTKRGKTLAEMICDTFFSQIGQVINSVLPSSLQSAGGDQTLMIGGAVVALLLWVGYLGSVSSYMVSWGFLALQTIQTLANDPESPEDRKEYNAQQTVWHNLLAIWVWRYLLTAVESITIPGLVSVIGLILHYLPSYFLWMTAILFGMLMTKKTSERMRANTWYARWLLGGFGAGAKKKSSGTSSSSSSGSSSGSSRERSSSKSKKE